MSRVIANISQRRNLRVKHSGQFAKVHSEEPSSGQNQREDLRL